jgi:hypothetical protein
VDNQGAAPTARGCESFVNWDDPNDFCGEPAIGVTFAACEHEHLGGSLICAACAAELQRAAGDLLCAHCDHECRFSYEIRFDSGQIVMLAGELPDASRALTSRLWLTWSEVTVARA